MLTASAIATTALASLLLATAVLATTVLATTVLAVEFRAGRRPEPRRPARSGEGASGSYRLVKPVAKPAFLHSSSLCSRLTGQAGVATANRTANGV